MLVAGEGQCGESALQMGHGPQTVLHAADGQLQVALVAQTALALCTMAQLGTPALGQTA